MTADYFWSGQRARHSSSVLSRSKSSSQLKRAEDLDAPTPYWNRFND